MPARKHEMSVRWLLVCFLVLVSFGACADGSRPVAWYEGMGLGGVSATQVSGWTALLKQPWHVDDEAIRFEVRDDRGSKAVVNTCETLFHADAAGMKATDRDLPQYRSWGSNCYAVRALGQAMASKHSFVADFVMDKVHVEALPVHMGFAVSRDEERTLARLEKAGASLGDYISDATVDVEKSAHPLGAEIQDKNGGNQGLRLLARGDFDHDGMEDLLISTYNTLNGGSYQAYGLFVITRTVANAPLKIVERFPVMGPGVD